MEIPIQETFQRTIQGEGFFAGTPCDFIRTYGCPVGCWFCDTGYADGGKGIKKYSRKINDLVAETKSQLVVISGGEPFIHKELGTLCNRLLHMSKQVSIETSGSFEKYIPESVWITLSPKEHISPKFPVKESFWERANEVKIVISKGNEVDYYREKLKKFKGIIYLQPEFSENVNNVDKIMKLLTIYGYRLSLQLHKIVGLR